MANLIARVARLEGQHSGQPARLTPAELDAAVERHGEAGGCVGTFRRFLCALGPAEARCASTWGPAEMDL